MVDTDLFKLRNSIFYAVTDRIRYRDTTDDLAILHDDHRGAALGFVIFQILFYPRRNRLCILQALAIGHFIGIFAVYRTDTAAIQHLEFSVRNRSCFDPAVLRQILHDRFADRMAGVLLDHGNGLIILRLVHTGYCVCGDHIRGTLGDRTCLIQAYRIDLGRALDSVATLDQDAFFC